MFHLTLQAFNPLRMSREFRERYRDVIDAVDELCPGFWMAMADELRRMMEGRVTTRSAVVRDFPAQREAGVQVVADTRLSGTRVRPRFRPGRRTRNWTLCPPTTRRLPSWSHPGTALRHDGRPQLPGNGRDLPMDRLHRTTRTHQTVAGTVVPGPMLPGNAPVR